MTGDRTWRLAGEAHYREVNRYPKGTRLLLKNPKLLLKLLENPKFSAGHLRLELLNPFPVVLDGQWCDVCNTYETVVDALIGEMYKEGFSIENSAIPKIYSLFNLDP